MNRETHILLLVACSIAGLSGCEAGLSGGTFTDPGADREPGTLVGSLEGTDGVPAAGTTVLFRRIGETRASTASDNLGGFQFESVSSGPARLVARAGDGYGAVAEVTVFAGGTKRAPPMQLRPLGEQPELLDVHGVGFEEQITSRDGGLLEPVYTSTLDRVIGARERGEEKTFEIVEIDPSTGRERVLLEADGLARLDGRRRWLEASEIFTLADDRYVVFRGSDARGWIVYDLQNRRVAFQSSEVEGSPTDSTRPAVAGEYLVLPHTLETRDIEDLRADAEKIRMDVFDLESGSFERGPPAGWTWSRGVDYIGTAERFAVIWAVRVCTNDSGEFADCFGSPDTGNRNEGYFAIDLEARESTQLERYGSGENVRAELPLEGAVAYTLHPRRNASPPETTVFRHDLETGDEQLASIPSCPDCTTPTVRAGPESASMYAWWNRADGEEKQFVYWDLDAGTTRPLETSVTIDEEERIRCGPNRCDPYVLGDGTLRIQHIFERSPDDWWGALVDVRGTDVVDRRVFDIWDGRTPPGTYDPFVADAADADVEILRLRRGSSGYVQYFVRGGPAGGEGRRFKQRTHLPAHHRDAALSADGETLLYVTRDPETGEDQLFRLQLDAYAAFAGDAHRSGDADD